MKTEQIETIIKNTLANLLKCDIGLETSRLNTPQWDSLKHINIMFTIEDAFDLEFTEEELAKLNSVQRIIDRVLIKYDA